MIIQQYYSLVPSLVPRPFDRGGGERAWYLLHAHAPTTPRKPGVPRMTVQGRSQKFFYTEADNKDCARIFSHAPFVDKPRPFLDVYCDRNNVESLLESRTVRKAVLSVDVTYIISERDIRLALLEMELYSESSSA